MAAEVFQMHKHPGRKDAVRISGPYDIPEFLQGTVMFAGDHLVINSVEGREEVPLGIVVAYEQSNSTATGWNAWWKANADETLQEINGEFYEIPQIVDACYVDYEFPSNLVPEGSAPIEFRDGVWYLDAGWGIMSGLPPKPNGEPQCVWIRYGWHDDGTPDMNILTLSEESARQYIVCDQYGNDICPLV